MTNIMSEGGDDTTNMFAELVSYASEGIDEYISVIAELQDASVMLGQVTKESAEKATQWAESFAQKIMSDVENDEVVPHYYVSALIEALYHQGLRTFSRGLNDMVHERFVEANV